MSKNTVQELLSVKEENIKRGNIYWSAIPFSEERPLGVFVSTDGIEGKRVEEDAETFKAKYNHKTKRKQVEEVNIIIRHKKRMVTVIQSDDIKGNFVYVLPITSIENDEEVKFYKENNDVPKFHYIAKTTGKEAVVNVADMKRVHKSLLMSEVSGKSIKDEDLEIIGKKLATLMDIEKIEKCEECLLNYKNYTEKNEINTFKIDEVVNK